MFKFYKFVFLNTLMIGTMISISSYSWMGIWMGLEINLLSMIPLMNNFKNILSTESSIKYFLTQALASTILLMTMILMSSKLIYNINMNQFLILMFNSALLTKMGAAPFHFWFPEVMEGLNWFNNIILLTWQKIAPMVILMYNSNMVTFFSIIIIFCMMISGTVGLNQVSLRKIMAYSSINHIGWMISSMFFIETVWLHYFTIYTIISLNIVLIFQKLNIFYLKQLFISLNKNNLIKMFFILNFLSLGGLPPFLGFFPKWLTIQVLTLNSMMLLAVTMIILTLMTLYFYMRITFSTILITMNELNYYFNTETLDSNILMINFITIISLILCTLTFNFI